MFLCLFFWKDTAWQLTDYHHRKQLKAVEKGAQNKREQIYVKGFWTRHEEKESRKNKK